MLSIPKFGLSEYAEKTRFLGRLTYITAKSTGFPLWTFFGNTRHIYEKNAPILDSLGRVVHGKVSWLIAYY